MTREIKFRAWDGLRMTTSGIMFNTSTGEMFTAKNMPLMQSIGLTDKDNKEIYDGDRVSYAGLNGTVTYDENTCTFKVKSDGRQRVLYQPLHKTCQAQITVIGNIYET